MAGTDDATPGQFCFDIGNKQRTGTLVEQACSAHGKLYGVRVPGAAFEDRVQVLDGATTFELADVSAQSGAQIQSSSAAAAVTEFLRPEDGARDPFDARVFYFVTTDRFDTPTSVDRGRLWRLNFLSASQPEFGGAIEMLLDGTEGQQMEDNLTVDRGGHLLIQEDPGSRAHLACLWQYTPATDSLKLIPEHDSACFVSGSAGFLTQDDESSGNFDASICLGPGWFLLSSEARDSLGNPLVEGGQLLALFNPDSQ